MSGISLVSFTALCTSYNVIILDTVATYNALNFSSLLRLKILAPSSLLASYSKSVINIYYYIRNV